jgi:hypothetical protein
MSIPYKFHKFKSFVYYRCLFSDSKSENVIAIIVKPKKLIVTAIHNSQSEIIKKIMILIVAYLMCYYKIWILNTKTTSEAYTVARLPQVNLISLGLNKKLFYAASILTPACGMGMMTEKASNDVLDLLSNLSKRMRAAI